MPKERTRSQCRRSSHRQSAHRFTEIKRHFAFGYDFCGAQGAHEPELTSIGFHHALLRRRRWAVEGPSGLQLNRRGFPKDGLKPGDVVEVCGYVPKEAIMWQIAGSDPGAISLSGRLINAETMVMPDGHEQSWGDYGVHKCFAPEYKDQHSK
jgi:hypothetical protein